MRTNNFSNADREFITKTAPSLGNRPEANEMLLTIKERQEELAVPGERQDVLAGPELRLHP